MPAQRAGLARRLVEDNSQGEGKRVWEGRVGMSGGRGLWGGGKG